jgi:hypothetical protein
MRQLWLTIIVFLLTSGCATGSVTSEVTTLPGIGDTVASSIDKNQTPGFRLTAEKEGVYRVCPSNLPGHNPYDLQRFELSQHQTTINTWIDRVGEETCLFFYHAKQFDRYALFNLYELVPADQSPERLKLEKPRPAASNSLNGTGNWEVQKELEQNILHEPLFEAELPWLWERIDAGETVSIPLEYSLEAETLSEIKLDLWSKSTGAVGKTEAIIPHAIQVNSDAFQIHQASWEGKGAHTVTIPVTNLDLAKGISQIELSLSVDEGLLGDSLYLDKITLSFQVELPISGQWNQTRENRALSVENGSAYLLVSRDQSLHVYQSGCDTGLTCEIILHTGDAIYPFSPQDSHTPQIQERLVAGVNQNREGDYVVIGYPEFLTELQPLFELRRSQGLQPVWIDYPVWVETTGGYNHPETMRQFLHQAYLTWTVQPRYVLLVGDYDHTFATEAPGIRKAGIPSQFIYTSLGGWTTSDADLVDFNRDGLPEIAIGRIPVDEPDELRPVIEKILRYEKTLSRNGAIPQMVVYPDPADPIFLYQAEGFIKALVNDSGSYPGTAVFNPDVATLQSGIIGRDLSWMVYIGHGSLTRLGAAGFLDSESLRLPNSTSGNSLFLLYTCLVGYFTHPQANSLAEDLLTSPGANTTALLAPSSLILPEDFSILLTQTARVLVDNPPIHIGDLYLEVLQSSYAAGEVELDILRTWHLIGDPALSLWLP